MVRHGGDEAKLSFEAVHFKCLLQDKEQSQKVKVKIPFNAIFLKKGTFKPMTVLDLVLMPDNLCFSQIWLGIREDCKD